MKTASRKDLKKTMAIYIIFSVLPLMLACLGSQGLGSNRQDGPAGDPESIEGQGQEINYPFAQSCLGGIVPGITPREEVIAALGQPVISEVEGDQEALFYSSATQGIFEVVLVEQGLARYTSRLFGEEDAPRLSGIFQQLGEPEYLAYSHFNAGSRTYVYPQQGVLFIADPNMDFVFIQDCFEPQDLANFLANYGENIPEENPYFK